MPLNIAAPNDDRDDQHKMFEDFADQIGNHFYGASTDDRWDIVNVLGSLVAAIKNDDTVQMALACSDYIANQRKFKELMGE